MYYISKAFHLILNTHSLYSYVRPTLNDFHQETYSQVYFSEHLPIFWIQGLQINIICLFVCLKNKWPQEAYVLALG